MRTLIEEHWNLVQKYYVYMNTKNGETRTYKYNKDEHFKYSYDLYNENKNGDEFNSTWVKNLLNYWIYKMKYEMKTGETLWYHFGA